MVHGIWAILYIHLKWMMLQVNVVNVFHKFPIRLYFKNSMCWAINCPNSYYAFAPFNPTTSHVLQSPFLFWRLNCYPFFHSHLSTWSIWWAFLILAHFWILHNSSQQPCFYCSSWFQLLCFPIWFGVVHGSTKQMHYLVAFSLPIGFS